MSTQKNILTPRELEVLILLGKGYDAQEVAGTIGCSRSTVSTHIRHIHSKLNVHTNAKAVNAGIRLGLIKK